MRYHEFLELKPGDIIFCKEYYKGLIYESTVLSRDGDKIVNTDSMKFFLNEPIGGPGIYQNYEVFVITNDDIQIKTELRLMTRRCCND